MLTVHMPATRAAERHWVAGVVLGEFLGLPWRACLEDRADILFRLDGSDTVVCMQDAFLGLPDAQWLARASLPPPVLPMRPVSPALAAAIGADSMPVLFGAAPAGLLDQSVPDVFGAVFFLLGRYEELLATPDDLDRHGRYRADASVAGRAGLLHRPLADEYVALLRHAFMAAWPQLAFRPRPGRVHVSCDVDRPFDLRLRQWPMLLHDIAMLLRRGDVAATLARAGERLALARHGDAADPNFAFAAYMDACEAVDLRATFNLLSTGQSALDADYRFDDPLIVSLLRRIHARGHAIGLHGSYASAFDPALLAAEAAGLRDVLRANGIDAVVEEGRQHYLRWDAGNGWHAAAAAGLVRDSTLGYADVPGFRCGTCREYPVFDLRRAMPLPLRERPLVAMDVTLLSATYQGLDADAVPARIAALADTCRRHGGDFTLLWHNNGMGRPAMAGLFARSLAAALGGAA